MTRPTKPDLATSKAIDNVLSASTIARCRGEGLSPAGTDALDHYRALAPYLGGGRSFDIAALRMAGEHRYPTRRLRAVLLALHGPAGIPGRETAEVLQATIRNAAQRVAKTAPTYDPSLGMPETPEQEAKQLEDGLNYDIEDLLNGETDLPLDDSRKIGVEIVTALGGPAEPGCEVYTDEFSSYMKRLVASSLRGAQPTIRAASLEDLATWVAVAAVLFLKLSIGKIPLGEEDKWRAIGALAPATGVIVELLQDIQSQL
jgi:hypothetical protein